MVREIDVKNKKNILEFSDGKFAFVSSAFAEANSLQTDLIFRIRKTGKGSEARTPEERVKKLAFEYSRQGIPDLGEFYLKNCKKFRPSDSAEITKWLICHPEELHDLIQRMVGEK